MSISLSEHFTYKKLLRFVFPSIIMMIFTSIYSVVDGLFVSNFVGKTALAAINLIMPFIMGISALGFMIGTGGSDILPGAGIGNAILVQCQKGMLNALPAVVAHMIVGHANRIDALFRRNLQGRLAGRIFDLFRMVIIGGILPDHGTFQISEYQ